jgi:hypothetical protein
VITRIPWSAVDAVHCPSIGFVSIAIAVMNGQGKLVMESILEIKASNNLAVIQGPCGGLHLTLEDCFDNEH